MGTASIGRLLPCCSHDNWFAEKIRSASLRGSRVMFLLCHRNSSQGRRSRSVSPAHKRAFVLAFDGMGLSFLQSHRCDSIDSIIVHVRPIVPDWRPSSGVSTHSHQLLGRASRTTGRIFDGRRTRQESELAATAGTRPMGVHALQRRHAGVAPHQPRLLFLACRCCWCWFRRVAGVVSESTTIRQAWRLNAVTRWG